MIEKVVPMKTTHLVCLILIAVLTMSCACPLRQIPQEAAAPPVSQLQIMRAADWGSTAFTDSLPTHQIRYITIHHGGEDFPADKDVIQYLRGLQSWSRSDKQWMDIPYHYMLDLDGNIYETRPIRFPGDTNTSYDVRGHALICVMGNYEHQIISPRQFEQLARLVAQLADTYQVPDTSIKSHKDYTETLCPGKDLYRYLQDGSLLKRVAELRTN